LPTEISTFEAFRKILEFISSRDKDAATFLKEIKLRCRTQRLLRESSDPGISSSSLQETEHCKDQMLMLAGTPDGPSRMKNSMFYSNEMSDMRRAKDEGWEVVEDIPLPPPPSDSEDVEHWSKAMLPDLQR